MNNNINENFINLFGISYDEFAELDYDDQQAFITEYQKKHPTKREDTLVMIGGGDESLFVRVPKDEKIYTPDGYFIAGETIEENKKSFFKKMKNKKHKKYKRKEKILDFETSLYLFINNAKIVEHQPVIKVKNKRVFHVNEENNINEVYVFKDFEEYKNYFLMYLNDIEDEVIKLAIYTKGNAGQIVAFKSLCQHIIVKKNTNILLSSHFQSNDNKSNPMKEKVKVRKKYWII